MAVFKAYASLYDIIYQHKDYAAECDFLERVFSRYARTPIARVLDLGCGTGGHALLLGRRGYTVACIDASEEMLVQARAKAASMGLSPAPSLIRGDIRDLDLDRTYDAVTSMFGVMSYMISNADLAAAISTAHRHLDPGGLFVFDAWFGPAVLTERPVDGFRIVESDGQRVIRFAHPTMDILRHVVEVNYKVLQIQGERIVTEVDEVHPMRYLFPQEIAYYLDVAGFRLLRLCPFLRLDDELSTVDWNVAVVASKG